MSNVIEYKGYIGSVEFSEQDIIFFGKILGIQALVSYEGKDAQSLIEDFHNAVDCYLESCKERGEEPEKAYKGSFNIRISPELHKQLAVSASAKQVSLNNLIETALKSYITTVRS